jgi:hypothetical protein
MVRLPQSEERQDRENDHDQSDQINQLVHENLLRSIRADNLAKEPKFLYGNAVTAGPIKKGPAEARPVGDRTLSSC